MSIDSSKHQHDLFVDNLFRSEVVDGNGALDVRVEHELDVVRGRRVLFGVGWKVAIGVWVARVLLALLALSVSLTFNERHVAGRLINIHDVD